MDAPGFLYFCKKITVMEKIPSFTIDHCRLEPGIFVSRKDVTASGDVITTFDIRMTRSNREPALDPRALHAMEHLAATFLRNHPQWAPKVIYWGPMGCCTGNYLLLQGDYRSADIVELMRKTRQILLHGSSCCPRGRPPLSRRDSLVSRRMQPQLPLLSRNIVVLVKYG